MENQVTFEKGIFMLSLDTELAWGTRGRKELLEDYQNTRQVIDEILKLCEKYSIKATWALVGHLFLDECHAKNSTVHEEIERPYKNTNQDWFSIDPAARLEKNPIWYGKDILTKIQNCSVAQEIGSHSFSHPFVDDPDMNENWYESELRECQRLAKEEGIELHSYVFPRNIVGFLPLLKKYSFSCFRGTDVNWYQKFSGILKKIAHVFDNYFLITPSVVFPTKESGLINIPGTYFYPHRHSWARFLPVSFRVQKSKKGILKAIQEKKIFHLWFHPFNIASDPDILLKGLEEIFAFVSEKRKEGLLENISMGDCALGFEKNI